MVPESEPGIGVLTGHSVEPEPAPAPVPAPEPEPEPGVKLGRRQLTLADPCCCNCPTAEGQASFATDGFTVMPTIVTPEVVDLLNYRLERVLRGEFDTGVPPDKSPKFNPESRVKKGKTPPALGGRSKRTLQVINVWKADSAFASVVCSPSLARAVAALGGWPRGARVANDQVWAKPPGAAPITFHRDSTYFDFTPPGVITVWIALDKMTPEVGTLEYVTGSHLWGDGRSGSASQFFDSRDNRSLVNDAARLEGIEDPANSLSVLHVLVEAGGGSVHNGRLWHGSGANQSATLPRRGLGIHFVPVRSSLPWFSPSPFCRQYTLTPVRRPVRVTGWCAHALALPLPGRSRISH
jgi:phytanoyl-CoA hydroxylase